MVVRHEPRLRTRTGGPEAKLVDDALRAGLLADAHSRLLLLREPAMATGYPDLVAAYPQPGVQYRAPFSSDELRVLQLLALRRRAIELLEIRELLRLTYKALNATIVTLDAARMIQLRDSAIALRPGAMPFVASRIVAIEAKIDKWEDALLQACANKWFASHSYVLLPSRSIASRALARSRELGIGVMALVNARVQILARARVQRLPLSLGSWIVNEWMVQELSSGDQS